MTKLTFTAVSRNYFNLPIWIAKHRGLFEEEGLDVAIELYEGVDEVTHRLRDGRAQLGYGITEHVVLDNGRAAFSNRRRQCQQAAVLACGRQEHRTLRICAARPRRVLDRGRQFVAGDEAVGGARPRISARLQNAGGRADPGAVGAVAIRRDRCRLAGRAAELHRDRSGIS